MVLIRSVKSHMKMIQTSKDQEFCFKRCDYLVCEEKSVKLDRGQGIILSNLQVHYKFVDLSEEKYVVY